MKIEVEIEHNYGDVCRYPVHKLVRYEVGKPWPGNKHHTGYMLKKADFLSNGR